LKTKSPPVKGAIVNCSPLGGFAGGNKRYRVKRALCLFA
jgi:hypothetical protein